MVLSGNDALLLEKLLLILDGVEPKSHVNDRFVWLRNKDEFSIKDCYKRICESWFLESFFNPLKVKALTCLWKSKVPSKVLIFGWRLIFNNLPTRMELVKREIIVGAHYVFCPLGFLEEEGMEHLFGTCFSFNLLCDKFCLWIRVDDMSSA